jgi:hypothetical protein
MPRPGRFTPGNDPVPIEQEAGWAPELERVRNFVRPPHWDSIPEPSGPLRVAAHYASPVPPCTMARRQIHCLKTRTVGISSALSP